MSTKRTDVHSPTNLVTEDYDFFSCGDYGTSNEPPYNPLITPMGKQLLDDGWRFGGVSGGGCDHCGARLRYYALMLHRPSHTIIRIGETCLDNRFALASSEFHKLRKAAKLNRERLVMAEVRKAWSADHGDVISYLADQVTRAEARYGYVPEPGYDDCGRFEFPLSLHAQLMRKGTLSERQVAAVRKSIVKQAEFDARDAAERATAEKCPAERTLITGTVLSAKVQHSNFGEVTKLTIKDDRGFKVWGNCPSSLEQIQRQGPTVSEFSPAGFLGPIGKGDRISFVATITPSDKDEFFGFYKRPANANLAA